jgi:hypothetical protein
MNNYIEVISKSKVKASFLYKIYIHKDINTKNNIINSIFITKSTLYTFKNTNICNSIFFTKMLGSMF